MDKVQFVTQILCNFSVNGLPNLYQQKEFETPDLKARNALLVDAVEDLYQRYVECCGKDRSNIVQAGIGVVQNPQPFGGIR
ncbi:MAG TPA: hypothetical protein VK673_21960 [Chthoniobacterales bacterium]|nr:hypothetical protein [Chthoniobacterales bacterium]